MLPNERRRKGKMLKGEIESEEKWKESEKRES
jgi:hypothetical protein